MFAHWTTTRYIGQTHMMKSFYLSFVYVEPRLEATAQTLLNSAVKCFYNPFLFNSSGANWMNNDS